MSNKLAPKYSRLLSHILAKMVLSAIQEFSQYEVFANVSQHGSIHTSPRNLQLTFTAASLLGQIRKSQKYPFFSSLQSVKYRAEALL